MLLWGYMNVIPFTNIKRCINDKHSIVFTYDPCRCSLIWPIGTKFRVPMRMKQNPKHWGKNSESNMTVSYVCFTVGTSCPSSPCLFPDFCRELRFGDNKDILSGSKNSCGKPRFSNIGIIILTCANVFDQCIGTYQALMPDFIGACVHILNQKE